MMLSNEMDGLGFGVKSIKKAVKKVAKKASKVVAPVAVTRFVAKAVSPVAKPLVKVASAASMPLKVSNKVISNAAKLANLKSVAKKIAPVAIVGATVGSGTLAMKTAARRFGVHRSPNKARMFASKLPAGQVITPQVTEAGAQAVQAALSKEGINVVSPEAKAVVRQAVNEVQQQVATSSQAIPVYSAQDETEAESAATAKESGAATKFDWTKLIVPAVTVGALLLREK